MCRPTRDWPCSHVAGELMVALFATSRSGPILVVRWSAHPTASDFASLVRPVAAERELAGVQLVYVTVLPDSTLPLMSEGSWRALLDHFDSVAVHCRAAQVVAEGSELARQTAERAFFTVIERSARYRNLRLHASLAKALSNAAPRRSDSDESWAAVAPQSKSK